MPALNITKKVLKEFSEKSADVANSTGRGRLRILGSMAYCLVRYGARPIDYERFRFWEKSAYQRNRYMTFMRYFKIRGRMDKHIIQEIGGCKRRELELFSEFIHRDWICIDADTDKNAIVSFLNRHRKVIATPEHGEQGHGVRLIENATPEDVDALIECLKHDSYIIEECVENAAYIKRLNPTSLNTIRAYSLINKDGRPIILSVLLRVGALGTIVDNWGSGGVGYVFDLETGICCQPGVDKKAEQHIFHPGTREKMVGFQLDKFEELKDLIRKMALVIPEARFVGWDIAITPSGFELIEMNCPGGHDFLQAFGQPFYDTITDNW